MWAPVHTSSPEMTESFITQQLGWQKFWTHGEKPLFQSFKILVKFATCILINSYKNLENKTMFKTYYTWLKGLNLTIVWQHETLLNKCIRWLKRTFQIEQYFNSRKTGGEIIMFSLVYISTHPYIIIGFSKMVFGLNVRTVRPCSQVTWIQTKMKRFSHESISASYFETFSIYYKYNVLRAY